MIRRKRIRRSVYEKVAGFVPDNLCYAEFRVRFHRQDDTVPTRADIHDGSGYGERNPNRRSAHRHANRCAHGDIRAAAHADPHSARCR